MQVSALYKPLSAGVLAASLDRLAPHGSVQVSTLYKTSSTAEAAAAATTTEIYFCFHLRLQYL